MEAVEGVGLGLGWLEEVVAARDMMEDGSRKKRIVNICQGIWHFNRLKVCIHNTWRSQWKNNHITY